MVSLCHREGNRNIYDDMLIIYSCQNTEQKVMQSRNKSNLREGYNVCWNCFREVLLQLYGHSGECSFWCC